MSALTDIFTSLANKIRSRLGTTTTYTPAQAIAAIDDVYEKGKSEGATPTQTKTVTAGTSATTVTPDTGYALSSVTVNPTPSQSKSATPSTSAQTISPDSGKLLSSVSISAIATETKTQAAGTSNVDVTPTSGKYLTKVTVTPTPTQEKTITASRSAQTVTPDSGKHLSKVTVNKYPDATGTYTYPVNSTGDTYDMGATNNIRNVNATNVYNKGKADGKAFAKQYYQTANRLTISCAVGDIFLGAGYDGQEDGFPTCSSGGTTYSANNFTVSKGTDYRAHYNYDWRIYVATSTSITFTKNGSTCVVFKLT